MRGRTQASVVALIGSWFPLISPATVALVSLRRGATDGLLVLLWALLPALATLVFSDMGPLMALVTVAGLLATFVVALLLRSSASWPRLLTGLVAASGLAALLLSLLVPDPVQQLTQALGEMMAQAKSSAPEQAAWQAPTAVFILGLIAYVIAVNALLSLLLARWWQSVLYNPGGFQTEFHHLRLQPAAAFASLVASLYCWQRGVDYQMWGNLFMLPLLVAGVAIVHRLMAVKRMAVQWLVLFYVALVFFSPLTVVLVVLGFMDTWLNFRERFAPTPPKSDDE
jgi:hypothetical protein